MLRKIKLYGELAKFVGHKEFEVKVESLSHAVSFLINNFEGVEKYMSPKHYQVKVGNYAVDESELCHPIGQEDIHFIPVICGAGGDSKFFLGLALVGIAIVTGGVGLSFGLSGFSGGLGISAAIGNLGLGLTLMGVSEMLFPIPKPQKFESEQDPRLSFSFSGIQNTSRAGTSIPIIYGEMMCGSVVISVAVDTHEVAV